MATVVALKVVGQPLVAFLIARFVVGLEPADVFAVTVIAALPTAQNVFTHAVRYNQGVVLARDSIFLSTVLGRTGPDPDRRPARLTVRPNTGDRATPLPRCVRDAR